MASIADWEKAGMAMALDNVMSTTEINDVIRYTFLDNHRLMILPTTFLNGSERNRYGRGAIQAHSRFKLKKSSSRIWVTLIAAAPERDQF